jgi:hypothetical protein
MLCFVALAAILHYSAGSSISQVVVYYEVIATSDYGFYVDDHNLTHLETTIQGRRRDYTLIAYKQVICIDDSSGIWYSCYIVKLGLLGNSTHFVLGMPSSQLRRGKILIMVDGVMETSYKVVWVGPNGSGQMIEWDPR